MNILALPSALAFTMNITLCLVVLSSNPKNIANRLFACFVLSFVTWNVGEFVMINSQNPGSAVLGVKIIFAGLAYIVIVLIVYLFIPTVRDLEDRLPDHDQMARLEQESAPTETGCA